MNKTKIYKFVSIFEEITTKLVESQEPNRLYNAAVQIAMKFTDAQACSLYLEQSGTEPLKKQDHIIMVAGEGFEKFRIGVAKYKKGQGLTGGIWKTSRSVKFDRHEKIEDQKKGWEGLYNDVVRDNLKNWVSYSPIGVPLRIGDKTIGVLKVENKKPMQPSCFLDEDQIMLEIIASTIVLAIENQKYSEQTYSSILNAL
ncbi:MAG: GAF domain-containing protein [Spirochaetes bacterium]|nr:GAF domain-containing protein [Spirochaetota bacterium]